MIALVIVWNFTVWRSKGWFSTTYFYYASYNNWTVSDDFTKDSCWEILSGTAGLATIPEYAWWYVGERGTWTSDPQLRVEGLTGT